MLELARALEAYAGDLGSGTAAARRELCDLVTVFRALLDWRLHEKREHVLFPWLVRQGYSWTSGSLEACHDTHCLERHLLDVLEAAAAREREWSPAEAASVQQVSLQLAQLERELIERLEIGWLRELPGRFGSDVLRSLEDGLLRFDAWCDRQPHTARALVLRRELVRRRAPARSAAQPRAVA